MASSCATCHASLLSMVSRHNVAHPWQLPIFRAMFFPATMRRTRNSSQFFPPCYFPATMWRTRDSSQFFPPFSCVSAHPQAVSLQYLAWKILVMHCFWVVLRELKYAEVTFQTFLYSYNSSMSDKMSFALEIQVCRTSSVRHGISGGRLVYPYSTNFCVISRSGKFIS